AHGHGELGMLAEVRDVLVVRGVALVLGLEIGVALRAVAIGDLPQLCAAEVLDVAGRAARGEGLVGVVARPLVAGLAGAIGGVEAVGGKNRRGGAQTAAPAPL